MSVPSIFAILVGINEYRGHPSLKSAAGDAKRLKRYLTERLHVPASDIVSLIDAEATRERIISELTSVPQRLNFSRDHAIIFFFSGYAGKTTLQQPGKPESVGIICPTDIMDEPGIPESTLIDLFGQISQSCGNNITVFLDCASGTFTWDNPESFVVIAPERATETERGGAFTDSLLNILQSERMEFLTVQSLVDRVQAAMNIDVHCYGRNVDHLLFNPTAGEAYHAFIPGCTLRDGRIQLDAGFAHGVQKDATYGIYRYNIKSDENRLLGSLFVDAVADTTATLRFSGQVFTLFPVFYAVETYCPEEKVKIYFLTSTHVKTITSWPSVEKVESDRNANITLKAKDNDTVMFSWNGVASDPGSMRVEAFTEDTVMSIGKEKDRIARMFRNAARFTYHLSRSPEESFLSADLHVRLEKVQDVFEDGTFKRKPSGKDILEGGKLAELVIPKGATFELCLVVRNDNKFPIWPFVLVFEPNGYDIYPWFLPQPGTEMSPLQAETELVVGCRDEYPLQFASGANNAAAITYVKVFATMERTTFWHLLQQYNSNTEDKLRNAFNTKRVSMDRQIGDSFDSNSPMGRKNKRLMPKAKWAAKRITIVQKYLP